MKRLTDTDKWKKPFIRSLSKDMKLVWLYLCDDCDFTGVWHASEWEVLLVRTGVSQQLKPEDALKAFGQRVHVFDNGHKWFIPDFIRFQYKELLPTSKLHNSVINRLQKLGLMSILSHSDVIDSNEVARYEKEQVAEKTVRSKKFDARAFYDEEIARCHGEQFEALYISLVQYLYEKNPTGEPAHHVLKLPAQLSYEQYCKLRAKCKLNGISLMDKLNDLINNTKYTKGRNSVFLILNSWVNRDIEKRTKFNTPSAEPKPAHARTRTGTTQSLAEVIKPAPARTLAEAIERARELHNKHNPNGEQK